MARNEPQVNLRIPAELKESLEELSETNKRSLTAEIVARLTTSIKPEDDAEDLFSHIGPDIAEHAAKHGMSFRQALETLVYAGLEPSAPAVVYISIKHGTSLTTAQAKLRELKPVIPDTATVITERETAPKKTKPK